jgi:hypothetical protein
MPKTRPERVYHYRGGVECGARYEWRNGYSRNRAFGVEYPWRTKRECQSAAKRDGFKAVFYRDGKKEN